MIINTILHYTAPMKKTTESGEWKTWITATKIPNYTQWYLQKKQILYTTYFYTKDWTF